MSLFSIIEISLQWQPAPLIFTPNCQHIHDLVYVKCMRFYKLMQDYYGKTAINLLPPLGPLQFATDNQYFIDLVYAKRMLYPGNLIMTTLDM